MTCDCVTVTVLCDSVSHHMTVTCDIMLTLTLDPKNKENKIQNKRENKI